MLPIDDFAYHVFVSHSSKDKHVAHDVATRLRDAGLRVWLDDWIITPGANIHYEIEQGLEKSRLLVLLMSEAAFGSDWARLESQTFRFRDPLNRDRRFIPLRLDSYPLSGSLSQFSYIDWTPRARKKEYPRLLEACWPPFLAITKSSVPEQPAQKTVILPSEAPIQVYSFSRDGRRALTGSTAGTIDLWQAETPERSDVGVCLQTFNGHRGTVRTVAWDPSERYALSGANDGTIRLWDIDRGECLRVLEGHNNEVWSVAWSPDAKFALSGANDKTLRVWDLANGNCLHVLKGHTNWVKSVSWITDGRRVLSGGWDHTIRLWDIDTGRCLRVLEGHGECVRSVIGAGPQRALSSSDDKTVGLWNTDNGRCLRVFEGHTAEIRALSLSTNQRWALSGSHDKTLRIWDIKTGRYLRLLRGHQAAVLTAAWSTDQRHVFSGDTQGHVRVWDVSDLVTQPRGEAKASGTPEQIQYTNAKVLLVGESGAGKTGLSKRLASNDWQPSDSTVGAWATQWKLPVSSSDGNEREIWLWDFGGQADQRLIHQLYMDETALAVLVFDGQKEDLFETLGQWDRDLIRASNKPLAKLLVAGRVDAGGLRTSRTQVEAFRQERGYLQFLETSAKTNRGCEKLRHAILESIRWDDVPWRTSPILFKRLKEEIVRLKDAGRALMRFNELRETLALRLAGEKASFTDDDLQAVVSLLAGPGVVWELKFGNWVLLQPERINAYAQAVIQTLREDELERGCIAEERVLSGNLTYQSSLARLEADEERFVLLAMHQTLVQRGLCLREHTDDGTLLVFPSYYRRERPELTGHPAIVASYRFNGFLDEVYATLVVRLHHTKSFQQDRLWRYAADFKTLSGKQVGVKLNRRMPGAGELQVYIDPSADMGEKIVFSKYVHEHLLKVARDVERLRHYVCPYCTTPVANREVAMNRLEEGKDTIVCVNCEKRIPLLDELEMLFASAKMKREVSALEAESENKLGIESNDRALVGEVISTVALSGQRSREFSPRYKDLDMEIELISDNGNPTGHKLYLLVSSIGRSASAENARGWRTLGMRVIRLFPSADGEVRWVDSTDDFLIAGIPDPRTPVPSVYSLWEEQSQRFDVMAVRRWREHAFSRADRVRPVPVISPDDKRADG